MPTSPTLIDALPTAPNRSMSDEDFVEAADAWVAAQPDFRTQINSVATTTYNNAVEAEADADRAEDAQAAAEAAQVAALGGSTRVATSASSHSFTAGSKTFAMVESGRTFAHPMEIVAFRASDVSARMYGATSGIAGQNITADFTSEGIVGSGGPYTDWVIADAGFFQTGATAAEIWALVSAFVAITPKALVDSQVEQALTDASTITPDFSAGRNFYIDTIGGNRTLANPTGMKVGQKGRIRVKQDGTGSRTLAYGSYWKRQGGAPALSTAASAEDWIYYSVEKTTQINFNIVKAPS